MKTEPLCGRIISNRLIIKPRKVRCGFNLKTFSGSTKSLHTHLLSKHNLKVRSTGQNVPRSNPVLNGINLKLKKILDCKFFIPEIQGFRLTSKTKFINNLLS